MKRSKKIFAVGMLLVLTLVIFAGCGSSGPLVQKEPKESEQANLVQMTGKCTTEVKDNKIIVYFESNLVEGTIVQFSIDSYDGQLLEKKQYTVTGENLYAEFAIDAEWKAEVVYANVVASPSIAAQPKEVDAVYGRIFENMRGEGVIWNANENIFVVQSEKIDLKK